MVKFLKFTSNKKIYEKLYEKFEGFGEKSYSLYEPW